MNNHPRGVYEPLMDSAPVYDLSDEEIEEEGRSRVPLLIVIALLVLAAFAGVVWLAYDQGVARGRASAIVIAAPAGPVRTAPSDAGGAATPFTGLKVYQQPVPPDQEAQASALAPASENIVVAPPVAKPSPVPAAPSPAAAVPAPTPASPPAPRSPVTAAAVLQIGAYESVEIANGAWAAFKARHADVAGTLGQDIQKADLGAKGIWYRLRVGPFADKPAAAAACEKLKAQGATCFVTVP
jgi:hypothetical protein